MTWFTKRRRAQTTNDYETWIMGGVSPTLNSFDNTGDSRPTVLIIDGTRVDDVRIYEEPVQTLKERMGTGGNNVPFIAQETTHDVVGTLQSRSYKGPNHEAARDGQLIIATDVEGSEVAATLRGFGHGWQGQHNSTNSIVQVEAYDEYNDTLGGDTHHALRAGTRQSTGVLVEAAGFKPGASADARSIGYQEGVSPSLEAGGGGNNRPAILTPTMHVRRLTPLECERLMGWPDNHTQPRADGKTNSDTNRYKMCGNGVASPVATWIANQINNI